MGDSIVPKHDHATMNFPKGFLWGSATSALQVEGNNIHSDWWEWENAHWPPERRSGSACDQYNKYEEDFDLIKKLNQNAHRLSIEWSRIEPEEGKFNDAEIEHYKKVLKALKDRDIKVMLTLHHFTNPAWFAKKGGWENFKAPFYSILNGICCRDCRTGNNQENCKEKPPHRSPVFPLRDKNRSKALHS